MPTWAADIILTSLAPSPMARVVTLGLDYLTNVTISDFYLGDTLHATTASHLSAIYIIYYAYYGFIAIINASPDIMSECLQSSWTELIAFYNDSATCYSDIPSTIDYFRESFNK